MRQIGDLLAVERLFARCDHDRVGDDVVDVVGAHRSRITEIVHLDGRRAAREIRVPRIAGEAVQVDRDVDLHPAQERGDFVVAFLAHVDEAIERGLDPRPCFAFVVGTERDARGLEPRLVVLLEGSDDQEPDRMRAQIRRQIRDPYSVVLVAFATPEWSAARAGIVRHPNLGRLEIVLLGCRDRLAVERLNGSASAPETGEGLVL